jgi:AraC-like DNA-binding protein
MASQALIDSLIDAWNRRSVADVLKLMDPQGSYHDAFWGETCSGRDLVRYLDIQFSDETLWYEQDGDTILLPHGVIVRYFAYDRQDPGKRQLVYRGAEVITVSNGLITGISDFYCDPDPVQLAEMAMKIERRRNESKVAELGLSEKTSATIRRRLREVSEDPSVFTDPELSTRRLAGRVGCTAAHLVHVLEEELGTSVAEFVRTRRAKYAASLLSDAGGAAPSTEEIARQSGFADVDELEAAFEAVYKRTIDEFREKSDLSASALLRQLANDPSRSGCYGL